MITSPNDESRIPGINRYFAVFKSALVVSVSSVEPREPVFHLLLVWVSAGASSLLQISRTEEWLQSSTGKLEYLPKHEIDRMGSGCLVKGESKGICSQRRRR